MQSRGGWGSFLGDKMGLKRPEAGTPPHLPTHQRKELHGVQSLPLGASYLVWVPSYDILKVGYTPRFFVPEVVWTLKLRSKSAICYYGFIDDFVRSIGGVVFN